MILSTYEEFKEITNLLTNEFSWKEKEAFRKTAYKLYLKQSKRRERNELLVKSGVIEIKDLS